VSYQVNAATVEWNPTTERLRELTEKMPNSHVTEFGNVAVKARVDSRSTRSTYIVDDSTNSAKQTITRDEYNRIAAEQDAYIAGRHMVVVDGYIGPDPEFRTKARLVMEAANANVAGMQKQLYYPAGDDYDPATWAPDTTVVLYAEPARPRLPQRPRHRRRPERQHHARPQLGLLRESKKGGLRMWNNIVYERAALALHAGCKVMPVRGHNRTVLIVGLSGTGKTTTTFTTQLGSKPAQDDFVALMPGGIVHATENGCFAKTFGLDPRYEPASTAATTKPDAYLENVSVTRRGRSTSSTPPTPRTAGRPGRSRTWTRGRRPARAGRVPAHPQPEREHRPGGRPARPGPDRRVLHAGRDDRHVPGGKDEEGKFLRSRGPTRSSRATWPTWATGCSSCSTATRCTRSC